MKVKSNVKAGQSSFKLTLTAYSAVAVAVESAAQISIESSEE
jgi:hypothetical protein